MKHREGEEAVRWIHSLGVGSHPVDDSILIKVMLVSECETLSFSQFPHKDEGGTLKVIPLLRHLRDEDGGSEVNNVTSDEDE